MGGSDSNDGKTPATPWKTMAKLSTAVLQPGQSVGLKRGCIWRETLAVRSSGSNGSPVAFGAYGSGNNPVLNGADIVAGWTPSASSSSTYYVASPVGDAWDDGSQTYNTTAYVYLSHNTSIRNSGFRFTGVSAPKAATLTSAVLGMYFYASGYDSPKLTFYGEASDNATSFATGSPRPGLRKVTAASAAVNLPNVGVDLNKRYPFDVTALVQEVIDRPGWASGNAVTILAHGQTGAPEPATVFSYRGGGPASLTVTYATFTTNVWSAHIAWKPAQVWRNGVHCSPVSSKGALAYQNQWYYDSSTGSLLLYSSTTPTSDTIEASHRYGILLVSQHDVTIDGLSVVSADALGVMVDHSSSVLISNLTVSNSGSSGINIQNGSSGITVRGGLMSNNGYSFGGDNNGVGIGGLGLGSSHITLDSVEIAGSSNDGVEVSSTNVAGEVVTDVIIQDCHIHGGYPGPGGGIRISGPGHSVTLHHNLIDYTNDHGVIITPGSNGIEPVVALYFNTIWHNHSEGFYMGRGNVTLENNIIGENGWGEIERDAGSLLSDYNCFYHSAGGQFMSYAGAGALDFAGWRIASMQDAHSLNSNPLLANPPTDYRLGPGSPCIGVGVFIAGVSAANPPNIGAF